MIDVLIGNLLGVPMKDDHYSTFHTSVLDEKLNIALNQQSFLKHHLEALQANLNQNGKEGLVKGQQDHKYQTLQSLVANHKTFLHDILTIEKDILREINVDDVTGVINDYSAGAFRRASTPFLQLVKDNQNVILQLIRLWRNLCSFLSIQLQSSPKNRLERLGFQLGLNELHFQINAMKQLLKKLERQQALLFNEKKYLNTLLKIEDKHLIRGQFPEVLKIALSKLESSVCKALPKKIPEFEIQDPLERNQQIENEAVPAQTLDETDVLPKVSLESEYDPRLDNALQYQLGVEQSNALLEQVMVLHIQGNVLHKRQSLFFENILNIKPDLQKQVERPEETMQSRLEQEALLRRTLFYPKPK